MLGLIHHGTVLYLLEHRVWAQQNGNKWQTVGVAACVVQNQQGFLCESNSIKAQDVCRDTEQNFCRLEMHPDETPETVLVYAGHGCVCLRTLYDSVFMKNSTVDTHSHSHICICIFAKSMGCDFNYSARVTTHQFLHCIYTLYEDLLPTRIGMNLTLVRKLLQHDDLSQLLKQVQNNGQRTLITVHHDAEVIYAVLDRVKKDGEYHWWRNFPWMVTNGNRSFEFDVTPNFSLVNLLCHVFFVNPLFIYQIMVLISTYESYE